MILYESSNLKVFTSSTQPTRSNVLVVCFQYKLLDQHLNAPGFGEEFFLKHKIDAVYVNCATNEWWQYPDLPEALSKLRDLSARWNRTVTYGSSMGGYAALRFSAAIGAERSIAVGPQYSPRSSVVPGENRFDSFVSRTKFLHEDACSISETVRNYVIYDPLYKMDRQHIVRYEAEASLVHIKVWCGGHTPAIMLVQCGLLTDLILELIYGEFCESRLRNSVRRTRKQSSQYWIELTNLLLERDRRDTARRVARRSLDFVECKDLAELAERLANSPETQPI